MSNESRFFMFTYLYSKTFSIPTMGNISFECSGFPNHNEVLTIICNYNEGVKQKELTLLYWKEFDSKEDFLAFTGVKDDE